MLGADAFSATLLQALKSGLKSLKSLGITGVHCDVWWGLVEGRPEQYDWSGYKKLFQAVKDAGLKLKVSEGYVAGAGFARDRCGK